MTTKDDLGFGDVNSTLAAAANFRPKPIEEPDPTLDELRRLKSVDPSVISQEPLKIVRKRKPIGVTNPLNMRVNLDVFNRFVNLSLSLNVSYAQTLEILMDKANIPIDGKIKTERKL